MDWCWSSNTLVTWYEELTHWKSPWCWERLKAGGEVGGRGWDGWMASPTQWTWAWPNSGRWWRTGKPGVLQSMGSQRVGHDWETEQLTNRKHNERKDSNDNCNWTEANLGINNKNDQGLYKDNFPLYWGISKKDWTRKTQYWDEAQYWNESTFISQAPGRTLMTYFKE